MVSTGELWVGNQLVQQILVCISKPPESGKIDSFMFMIPQTLLYEIKAEDD